VAVGGVFPKYIACCQAGNHGLVSLLVEVFRGSSFANLFAKYLISMVLVKLNLDYK
jgi:hypothetical protein